MAVAAAFDHDLDAHDDRAADVRVVLALDAGVARFGKHGPELATASGSTRDDRALSAELNRELGALVVKRTARRRVRTLLGREIPFGVGVAIGAGSNFKAMRHTGRTALRYYEFTVERDSARVAAPRRTPAARLPRLGSAHEDASSCSGRRACRWRRAVASSQAAAAPARSRDA